MRQPKYRKHTSRDFAFVEWRGQRHRLPGKYGSAESRDAYASFVAKHVAKGVPIKIERPAPDQLQITLLSLATRFLDYAKVHYRGTAGEYSNCRQAFKYLKDFASHPASDFGPLKLKAVQQKMVGAGCSRNYINSQVGRIKRLFAWGVSEELIPTATWQALLSVQGLRAGRTKATEHPKRRPVEWADVAATVEHLGPVVKAMVLLQWLTGARPGSIFNATPGQFDRSGADGLWRWRPRHKTEHLGAELVIPVGPQAQRVLAPFMDRDQGEVMFSPRASGASGRYGKQYNRFSYRQAVHRAQVRAKVRQWSPYQLRHSRGTVVRGLYGIEGAQAALGHESLSSTQVYAGRRAKLAEQIAAEIG